VYKLESLVAQPGKSQQSLRTSGRCKRNGSFATLNYRNDMRVPTALVGIDNNGVIVGNKWYSNGFLYKNGVFKDIVGPHGEPIATMRGISANGVIAGDLDRKSGVYGFTVKCQ